MRTLGAILFLVASGAAASAAPADSATLRAVLERGELRVGLEAGYMPFEMRDKSGEIIGFDVDLARLMARRLGVKLRLVNVAWDGIIPALLTQKFDLLMSGMTITAERARSVDFSDPYIEIGQTLLVSRAVAPRVKSYEDLNSPEFRVVTKLGTTGEIATRQYIPRAQIRTFETEADATIEVRNGRADAFVYDMPYNVILAAQNRDSLVHVGTPFTREQLGWAIRKGDPGMLRWLNEFLADIKADGTYDAMYRKWFENDAWLANVN